jgi:hypothetical protein
MLDAASGLTEVTLDDLKKLLRLLHREEITCPLTIAELTRCGLQHCSPQILGACRGVAANGVRAVVVAVIAERLPSNEQRVMQRTLKEASATR